ncbi:hypothetical protein TWF696_000340 [Orbilia brochopaga]|uniref:Uncharacterized protein n=1 Tax=Orbilia brochopaga TaxID=3140254 RepID=A0AAV9VAZ5_9PEZI
MTYGKLPSSTSITSMPSNPPISQTLRNIHPQSPSKFTAADTPELGHSEGNKNPTAHERIPELDPPGTTESSENDKRDFPGTPLDIAKSIQCATISQILFQMNPNPSAYPRYPNHYNIDARNRTDYREIRDPAIISSRSFRRIFNRLKGKADHWATLCNNCRCIKDTPFIVPNFEPEIIVDDDDDDDDPMFQLASQTANRIEAPRCSSWEYATVCRTWYNCRCNVEVKLLPASGNRKESNVDILLADLEEVINGRKISMDEKPTFHGYDNKISSGSTQAEVRNAFPMGQHRHKVSDTIEPYYLEGPSVSSKGTWDWLRSPLLGLGTLGIAQVINPNPLTGLKHIFRRNTHAALDADGSSAIKLGPLEDQKKCPQKAGR